MINSNLSDLPNMLKIISTPNKWEAYKEFSPFYR